MAVRISFRCPPLQSLRAQSNLCISGPTTFLLRFKRLTLGASCLRLHLCLAPTAVLSFGKLSSQLGIALHSSPYHHPRQNHRYRSSYTKTFFSLQRVINSALSILITDKKKRLGIGRQKNLAAGEQISD